MSRAAIILGSPTRRQLAASYCMTAPAGTYVEFVQNKRSLPQNARLHAMCTDVANQIGWTDVFGRPIKMSMENWKRFFLAVWSKETLVVPNPEGTGFIDLGVRSSKLTKAELGEVMELIAAFGAERGVKFHDDVEPEPRESTPSRGERERANG